MYFLQPMDIVLLGGALAILVIIVLSVRGAKSEAAAEERAHHDYQRTVERGVQPVSLHPKVDPNICIGSGSCIELCPETDVLGLIERKAKLINPTACIGHGECLRACPVDAITLVLGTERRGVDIPLVQADFQSNVDGLYIVGELGGMGLIYNAMTQALQCIAALVKTDPPKVDGVFQVAIIGAGPAGIAASLGAMDAGLDFVTIDQESIGGTVLHYPRHKVVMTRPVELPGYGKVEVDTVKKEALLEVWHDIVAKTGLSVRTETKVDGVSKGADGVFELATSGGLVRAQRVVLAMGRRGSPRKLGVPGEDLGKVTYRLIEAEGYAGKSVMVVGGGDSAVEAAIALGESGATTQLVYRRAVFDRIKPKNQQRLDAAAEAGHVELVLNANPKAITERSVSVEVDGTMREFDNDYVIVSVGGVLPTKFLEAAGVEVKTFKGEAFAPANA